ncbi:hypothetical protein C345_00362 [Cryptococcus neoformans A2-102-5]|nr:hypothetical protein C346_00624 [Cryptococcus neoformans var. grubii D17-1]OXG99508.1 hypothetical protein C345_00362 [Cryptococcus neoformans var. grubii A2-102-5]
MQSPPPTRDPHQPSQPQSSDQSPQPETPATPGPSSSSSNPLYPTILPTSATLLATKLGPTLPYYQSQTQTQTHSHPHHGGHPAAAPNADPEETRRQEMAYRLRAMPEKCFSWCTQSEMGRPFCRMFCVRKRAVGWTREEQLKRLRPQQRRIGREVEGVGVSASADVFASMSKSEQTVSSSSSSSPPPPSIFDWLYSPIETLRSRITPYSIIYIRGTPDGVIGRYMEELEWDDGVYDFKGISRGQVAKSGGRRRDEEPKMEWLEWGDHGALLHLPLASIFSPILALPDNMNRLLSPSLNLLSAYKASFVEGGQARNLTRFVETVRNNGAGEMVGKINTFIEKRVQEGREKREEMMKQRQERMKDVGKEVEGKGEERQ